MKHNALYENSLQHQHRLVDCVCKIFKFLLHGTRAITVPGVCVPIPALCCCSKSIDLWMRSIPEETTTMTKAKVFLLYSQQCQKFSTE